MTSLAFLLHIGGGAVSLISGAAAAIARKGGELHRRAGTVFVISMLIMATFAGYLAVAMPGQIVNLFIAVFTLYLIVTGWRAIQSRGRTPGLPEKIALVVSLGLCAPFGVLSFQLAAGLPVFFDSALRFHGPILIAIYSFTSVLVLAAIGDARLVFTGGMSGKRRIARHLWRMCLGLTLSTGSAFTNGFARLLPGPYHVPAAFFFPQFVPLGLLIFWMIRLRFTSWTPGDSRPLAHRAQGDGRSAGVYF